jgi:predicted RNA-binding Zn ribbon-like protein
VADPQQLALFVSFGNSIDIDSGQDDFDSPDRFGRWLAAHGFEFGREPTAAELEFATVMRDAIRAELHAHHDGGSDPDARARLDSYAGRLPLRAAFGDGPATLVAAGEGVEQMLGEVVAQMVLAERDGTWSRLKICREDTCQWVFFDQSKNQSKTWCSMGTCGNRNKTRSYRSRRRAAGTNEAS